jgi:hypothetical protein
MPDSKRKWVHTDLIPTPEDASIAASLGGRPVFQYMGTSVTGSTTAGLLVLASAVFKTSAQGFVGTRVGSFQDMPKHLVSNVPVQ